MKQEARIPIAVATLFSVLTTTMGCYSVRPNRMPLGPDKYALSQALGAVQIGIEPLFYSDADDLEVPGPFDVNLKRKKILILQVEGRKQSNEPLQIATADIELTLKDGSVVRVFSSEQAAKKGKRSGLLVVFPWVIPLLSTIGIIVSAVMVHKANKNMRADFANKALASPAVLTNEQSTLGFVYFILERRPETLAGIKVTVPVVNTSTGERTLFEQTLR